MMALLRVPKLSAYHLVLSSASAVDTFGLSFEFSAGASASAVGGSGRFAPRPPSSLGGHRQNGLGRFGGGTLLGPLPAAIWPLQAAGLLASCAPSWVPGSSVSCLGSLLCVCVCVFFVCVVPSLQP